MQSHAQSCKAVLQNCYLAASLLAQFLYTTVLQHISYTEKDQAP